MVRNLSPIIYLYNDFIVCSPKVDVEHPLPSHSVCCFSLALCRGFHSQSCASQRQVWLLARPLAYFQPDAMAWWVLSLMEVLWIRTDPNWLSIKASDRKTVNIFRRPPFTGTTTNESCACTISPTRNVCGMQGVYLEKWCCFVVLNPLQAGL